MTMDSLVSTPRVPLACVKIGLPYLPMMTMTQTGILSGSEVALSINFAHIRRNGFGKLFRHLAGGE
jgi:hypothetical protein